ncbi:MAG: tetratricopeptide repeat protein [Patescibacteria group bacterium]
MPIKQKVSLVLFGILLCCFILELGLQLSSFAFLSLRKHKNKTPLKSLSNGVSYCILCLGESTTALGEDSSWPTQLEKILNENKNGISYKVINMGRMAVESSAVLSLLKADLDKYNPDMVITMIGVNDWVGTIPYQDSRVFRIKLFISRLKSYKLARLVWLHTINKVNQAAQSKKQKDGGSLRISSISSGGKQLGAEAALSNGQAFVELGYYYYERGEYKEAEHAFKKAISADSQDAAGHIGLGQCYREQDRNKEMEKAAKQAIRLDPGNADAYILLGNAYQDREDYRSAEEALKQAVELNPRWEPAYTELGSCYRKQGKVKEAHDLAKRIIKEGLVNDRLYGFVATSYVEEGRYYEAGEYYRKAEEFRLRYYNPATRHNYNKLREILVERGIKFVCMQYPMRSIEPLKKIFDSNEDIIFVSNEKIFKEELKKARYEDLFVDSFGGEFGHATARGNRLIAENLADTIIKEVSWKE